MDFSSISHSSIIHNICDSEDFLRRLKNALKSNIPTELKEKLSKIGHSSMRSIMWILEACVLECDFAVGKAVDKPQGYCFDDLYFNMLSSFDGFKGVHLEQDWIPPMDTYCHWSNFFFDASVLMKYFQDMKDRLPGRRTHLMLFIVSVGLAVLAKNPQIRVHKSNWMSLLGAFTNELGLGLLKAFLAVSPRVQDDLDRTAVYCNEYTRTRKTEKMKLPGVGSLLPRDPKNPLVSPAAMKYPNLPPPKFFYYLPETMHPSWFSTLPHAQLPLTSPLSSVLSRSTSSNSSLLASWDPTRLQSPAAPVDTLTLSTTRELPYIPLNGKLQSTRPRRQIRRYINRAAREQIVSLIRLEDFQVPRKEAAKSIMQRQKEATGSCDTEGQIIYLLTRLNREKQMEQLDGSSP